MNKTEKMPLKTVRYCFLTHLLKYAINVLQEIPTDRSPQAVPKNSLKSFTMNDIRSILKIRECV